jgi:hypothetical protein
MSCLFDSLCRFLKDISSLHLRIQICNYLASNPILLDDLTAEQVVTHETSMSLQVYIANMRMPSSMGGAIEIRSFTKLYRVNVKVNSLPNKRTIEFLEDPSLPWLTLEWTGGHFTPVI